MRLLALLLHAALLVAAAPALDALMRRVAASWRGESVPPFAQPWRDLVRLWRKSVPLPGAATYVFRAAPAAALGAASVAALLVPSFTLGLSGGDVADFVVVAGLLMASRAAQALGGHDAGWAAAAQEGAAALAARLGMAPVLLVLGMALVLLSGGTNLVAAAAAVRDGGPAAHVAGLLAGMAALAVAAAEWGAPAGGAGRLGATSLLAAQMRLLAGLGVAAALALPFGVAPEGGGALTLLFGAVCWVGKLACLGVLAAALRGWRFLLPAAALLAVAAVAVASVQGRA